MAEPFEIINHSEINKFKYFRLVHMSDAFKFIFVIYFVWLTSICSSHLLFEAESVSWLIVFEFFELSLIILCLFYFFIQKKETIDYELAIDTSLQVNYSWTIFFQIVNSGYSFFNLFRGLRWNWLNTRTQQNASLWCRLDWRNYRSTYRKFVKPQTKFVLKTEFICSE